MTLSFGLDRNSVVEGLEAIMKKPARAGFFPPDVVSFAFRRVVFA